jgi:hypothetical protein
MREGSASTQTGQAACSRAGPLAVAAAVLALVAACSGGGSHPAGSGVSSSPNLAAMNSYARCLRTHGLPKVHVTLAPSAPNLNTVMIFDGLAIEGATRGSPQVRAAVQACHHLLPQP